MGRGALPNPAEVRRTLAFVVDDFTMSVAGLARVRDALRKYVNNDMQPGDLVAIIRTSSGMGLLQQFTSDRTVLNAAIDRVKISLDRANVPHDTRKAGTFGAVQYVIDGLRDMPGRKCLILFSENLPIREVVTMSLQATETRTVQPKIEIESNDKEPFRRLTDAANRASVVINTIDTGGVTTWKKRVEGLGTLAEDTGGIFIDNNNDIDDALGKAVADTEGYYLIGYHPDAATFDSKSGAPLYRSVRVRVKIAGLRVRSRSGFLGETDKAKSEAPLTSKEALFSALASPFSAGDMSLQLTTLFSQTPDKRSNLSSLLHIDAHDLSFTQQADGSRHAGFEVVAMTFGVDGVGADHSDKVFNVDLDSAQYEAALSKGLVYLINQPVQKPGLYQMRVALRDQTTGRLGTANQFIEVPDLKDGRLALSSVLLRRDAAGATGGVDHIEGRVADNDPATGAALRVFKPGSPLAYEYLVFNAQSGAARNADLEVQTRLYHDGKLVYEGKPMVPSLTGEAASGRLLAGGHMTLAEGMSPGDYLLQVTVTDKLAKQKFQSTSQTTDFTVQ